MAGDAKIDWAKALATFVALILFAFVAYIIFDQSSADQSTSLTVDFTKPLFVKKGLPACPSSEAVEAIIAAAVQNRTYLPAECGLIKRDTTVVILKDAGAAGPYLVRFIDAKVDAEAWVPYSALRN